MRKIIYFVCLMLILGLIIENTNFIYAENGEVSGMIEDSELIDEEINNLGNQNQSGEKGTEYEEINEIDEIVIESNDGNGLDLLEGNKEIQVFEVNQVYQEIDTSDYGIIRIKDPNNTGKGITILDRNLGATATGAGIDESRASFGYYYQWGNNYGFPSDPNAQISTTGTQVDTSGYGPNTDNGYYSSNTFIKGNNDWSIVRNDNLWGGSGDSKDGNGRGYPVTNPEDRRGPCPENYHVPSIGEWSKLLEFRAGSYTGLLFLSTDSLTNLKYFVNKTAALNLFYENLYISIAGRRSYQDLNFENVGIQNLLRSSSPKGSNNTTLFILYGESSNLYSNGITDYRAYAHPIRCFYNSYRLPVKITYEVNGGYRADDKTTEDKVITYTKDDDNSEYSGDVILGAVKRNDNCGENGDKKCMFGGWHTLTGNEMRTGNITEDITLYAKWLEFDDKDISYSGVNLSVIDRNLGAISSGTEDGVYGYYLAGGEDISCPGGYHIPSTGEWLGVKKLLGSNFNGNLVKDWFNLPFAGKSVNGEIVETGVNGYYLAKDGDGVRYAKISNSGVEISDLDEGEKVSVRCFKDYNTGTIKFYSNGGNEINDIVAVNRREEGEDLQIPERDDSIFSGWYTTSDFQEGTKLERNINYKNEKQINLYAKWECEEGYQKRDNKCDAIYFDITWIDGDGNILKIGSIKWGNTPVYSGDTPTKSSTADYKYTFNGNWLPEIIPAYEDTGYIAQFDTEIIKKSGGSSGGGGGTKKDSIVLNEIEKSIGYQTGNSSIDFNPSVTTGQLPLEERHNGRNQIVTPFQWEISNAQQDSLQDFSQEFIDAYNFAYKNGITTKKSIYDAKMYSPLTRIQMAKMLSNYAINVLGKEPDISKGIIKFSDVSDKLNKEYDNAINLSYQLGIMGQNIKNNKFRPYDEVTRAEFTTALSRLLYGIEDGKNKYYEPHISKLYNEGIINRVNPNIKEKRGYVMLMLTRNIK